MELISRWKTPIGALLLAIIASATWDFLFKPILLKSAEFITLAATFGLTGLVDGIYTQISLGDSQNISTFSAAIVTIVFVSAPFGLMYVGHSVRKSIKKDREPTTDDINVFSKNKAINALMYFLSIFFAFYICLAFAREIYVSGANITLNTYEKSIAPYISEQSRLEYASRRTRIRSRAEFESLVNELKALAEKHGHPPTQLLIL